MKILIIGHGRHGKDTLAEIWGKEFGVTHCSSSYFAFEKFIWDEMKCEYSSMEECYADRSNRRKEWYDLICEYNGSVKSRLARGLTEKYDIYVGMRDIDEFVACVVSGIFDFIIYVDASERLPLESEESFNIPKDAADVVVKNNGGLPDFIRKAKRIGKTIFK